MQSIPPTSGADGIDRQLFESDAFYPGRELMVALNAIFKHPLTVVLRAIRLWAGVRRPLLSGAHKRAGALAPGGQAGAGCAVGGHLRSAALRLSRAD